MELNPDCVRDVLLAIEQCVNVVDRLKIDTLKLDELISKYDKLKDYSVEQVAYTIMQLNNGKLVEVEFPSTTTLRSMKISNLTFKGHEYLEKIRSDTVWNKTKDVAKGVGSLSLDFISQVASNVLTAMLTKAMQGTP